MSEVCTGRCSGCALKIGAKANVEISNRTVAVLAAFGGIPFYCHEKMGWTPDQETYPASQTRVFNALDNLIAAPKLIHDSPDLGAAIADATAAGLPADTFDEDRELIGKIPICGGWKRAVRKLNNQGWFQDRELRKVYRKTASETIRLVDQLKVEKDPEQKQKIIHAIGAGIKFFAKVQREKYGHVIQLEEA